MKDAHKHYAIIKIKILELFLENCRTCSFHLITILCDNNDIRTELEIVKFIFNIKKN